MQPLSKPAEQSVGRATWLVLGSARRLPSSEVKAVRLSVVARNPVIGNLEANVSESHPSWIRETFATLASFFGWKEVVRSHHNSRLLMAKGTPGLSRCVGLMSKLPLIGCRTAREQVTCAHVTVTENLKRAILAVTIRRP